MRHRLLLSFVLLLCIGLVVVASASASPPTATTESATAVAYTEAILKGAVNPEGSETSYWFEYGETESYGSKIPASPKSVGSGASNVTVSQLVSGLKESTTYHFRIVAESEGGTTKGKDAVFSTAGFNFSFGEEGTGKLSEPFDLAVDSKGNVWVSDTGNNRVVEFNEKGEYLFQFGKKGTGSGEFNAPKGIAIDPTDSIWVVGSGNNRLQKFNIEGKFILKAGEEGSGEAQFKSPTGITIEHSGERPLVADTGNNRIEKLTKEGKYLAKFGQKGTGDGELMSPEGILSDSKGRIWVVDTGNDRVQRFNPSTLNFVSKFGKKGTGEGNELIHPIGISSDFQEKLWVVDSGNNRLQKFDIEGDRLDVIGAKGTGAGQFEEPTGVEPSVPQKLLAIDSGNHRAEQWTVKAEPPNATTSHASDIRPTSMILNANLNPRGLTTSYWFEYGPTEAYGTKAPITPESIGSGLANVLVEQKITGLEEGKKYYFRVVAESTAGKSTGKNLTDKTGKQPKAITDPATAISATKATLKGLVNPEASETSYWFEYGETPAYGNKIPLSPALVGSGTSYVEVSQTPTGLKEGAIYHFQVVAEAEPGHPILGGDKSFTTLKLPDATTDAATAVGLTQATLSGKVNPLGSATNYWFEYGETTSYGAKIPVSPESVGSGTEYVAVTRTPTGLKEGATYHFRVVAESEAGMSKGADRTFTTGPRFSFSFGSKGSANGQFLHPAESVVDAEGNLWVVDKENCRVEEFDPEGNYLFQFGEEGSEPGQFSGLGPESIAIDTEGNLWVADTYNGRLQEFDQEGNLIQIVGSYGSEPGQLGEPTGIDIGPSGNIWIADWLNKRVTEFNEAGEFVRQVGKAGSGNGEFINPDSIEVDETGTVWVLDEGNDRIQRFDEEGKYLGKFGSSGSGEGQFNFGWPAGITSDAEGNLWIADSLNNRVQKWAP